VKRLPFPLLRNDKITSEGLAKLQVFPACYINWEGFSVITSLLGVDLLYHRQMASIAYLFSFFPSFDFYERYLATTLLPYLHPRSFSGDPH
jgi:hypothetical protein